MAALLHVTGHECTRHSRCNGLPIRIRGRHCFYQCSECTDNGVSSNCHDKCLQYSLKYNIHSIVTDTVLFFVPVLVINLLIHIWLRSARIAKLSRVRLIFCHGTPLAITIRSLMGGNNLIFGYLINPWWHNFSGHSITSPGPRLINMGWFKSQHE